MNSIHIKGRLTRDPETRHTDSGKSVTNFSVAVNRRFNRDKADFFNVTAWEKTGEFVEKYFRKGSEIIVEGEMQSREYTDRDGNKRIAWELITSNVEFCGSKSDSAENAGRSYQPATGPVPDINPSPGDFEEIPTDDDLPF
ncbi:single-stranded DNA-binding protein [Clostridium minihomine]|uniref:single-stranded DNA-binding protein n=1 Tax=Clostridium minihomine TaxID=2045012 RepID=UPI000C768D7D|nr:single-stranded DNA-binding protein [Clostridium minihomine]